MERLQSTSKLQQWVCDYLSSLLFSKMLIVVVRVMQSVAQSSEDVHMQQIAAREADILGLARLMDAQVNQDTSGNVTSVRKLLEQLDAPINRLAQQVVVSTKSLEEKKRHDLLRWLSAVPFSRHNDFFSADRIPATGKWLVSHPQYVTWRASSSSSIMLLHGVAGSGKSSLASTVIDSFLQEVPGGVSSAQLAYFYCAKDTFERERSDPDEIMRSLVRQITLDDSHVQVHEALIMDFERREAEAKVDGFDVPRLRVSECVRLMLDALGANPAVLVVDAVDEVQEDRRHELLDGLCQLTRESASVVKVFVTSRNNNNILALLPGALTIGIQRDDNKADMELFVRHHVTRAVKSRRLLNGVVSDELEEYLIQMLCAKAEEMYIEPLDY